MKMKEVIAVVAGLAANCLPYTWLHADCWLAGWVSARTMTKIIGWTTFYVHLPVQWVPGILSLGVKWLGHEADHPSSSSAKVKNVWSYTSTPPLSSWHGA